jgi:hypothetical protein
MKVTVLLDGKAVGEEWINHFLQTSHLCCPFKSQKQWDGEVVEG